MNCCSSPRGPAKRSSRETASRAGLAPRRSAAAAAAAPAAAARPAAAAPVDAQLQWAVAGGDDDSGSDADSFHSADDVLPEPEPEPELEPPAASGLPNVPRVLATLSSMSPASAAAQGWERAAAWSGSAGSAAAFRKPATDDTGVFVFYFEADFPAIPASVIYRVQTDLAFREEWDTYCEECVSLGHQADGCELVYWLVAYPWPLTKRDYVYGRCLQEPDTDTGPYVVASRACPLGEHCPENEEYVRVCTFTSELTITPVASGGCKMKLLYQDDPRGSLPKRVVNWAATKGFASAMQDLVRAAEMAMNINMNMKERRAQAGD